MAVWETLVATAGGAASVTVGVAVGAVLTRRAQDRHWLRDRQLAAYEELLRQYATFAMVLRRAHLDRRSWDYDWAAWSAALTKASLVAPVDVANEIDRFGHVIGMFLERAAVDTSRGAALDAEQFDDAMRAPAAAQLSLLNAMRRSLSRHHEPLSIWLGGSQTRPPHWRE